MKIVEVRLGHATNSSSSHSIVKAGTSKNSDSVLPCHYGWETFLLKSPQDKRLYMTQMLYEMCRNEFGPVIASIICNEVFGKDQYDCDGYVDHQSVVPSFMDYKSKSINTEFYKEMAECLINDDSAHIAGGNDNEDSGTGISHPDWEWITEYSSNHKVVTKVSDTVWRLFNPDTGNKIYFDFSKDKKPIENYIPKYPELIDLKITDYCNKGCAYCYQNSTPKGKHADLEVIRAFATKCKKYELLEVAIGGGEPTLHPYFYEIVKIFKDRDIVVNISTRDYALKQGDITAVGFSIDSHKEAMEVLHYNASFKKVFHYIPDLYPVAELERILKICDYKTILLLGVKDTGRGKSIINKYHHDDLFDIIKKYKTASISIDTKLARDYAKELEKSKISKKLYKTVEGIHSYYVDLVNMKCGVSSYTKNLRLFSNVNDIFKNWKEE